MADRAQDEAALLKAAMAGARDACDTLLTLARPGLEAAARRLTGNEAEAEDLVQEALSSAWRSLSTLRHPEAWRRWLYHILLRRNLDRIARRKGLPPPAADVAPASPLENLLQGEVRELARRALDSLPDPARTILAMRFLQGLSLQDIADRTRRPLGTVKYLVHEGLRDFERAFQERIS